MQSNDGQIVVEGMGVERVPMLEGTSLAVIDVVRAAYCGNLSAGPDAVLAAVRYCADRHCETDRAFCEGCRLKTEHQGIGSIDAFCLRFEEIEFSDSGMALRNEAGHGQFTASSLDELVKSWRGEEIWFLARRVHRRMHREASTTARDAREQASPTILLMEPQLPENIGMVARAMANFGLDDLRLIAPRSGWPDEQARVAAAGANAIIDSAAAHRELGGAIGDLTWVCATTARQRDLRKPVLTPEQAALEMRRRTQAGERCGILFGRERNGLETSEVAYADALVMIPVDTRFASLNLAQAVLILGYEWMLASEAASLGRVTTYEQPLQPGLNMGADRASSKEELFGFFDHLEAELLRLGFFNPPHKRPTVVQNLRTMFTRMAPTEQEVRTLRGIVATLAKGKGHGRKPST